jgi:hypothetical protein
MGSFDPLSCTFAADVVPAASTVRPIPAEGVLLIGSPSAGEFPESLCVLAGSQYYSVRLIAM